MGEEIMFRAFLFDLDGTLLDSSEGIINAAKEALRKLNICPPMDDEIKSCIGLPIGELLGERYGWGESEKKEFYDLFRPIYRDKYVFQCSLFPGIVSLLSDLKETGCYIGIATNKRKDSTELLLHYLKLADFFDIVVSQDQSFTRDKSDMILDALSIIRINKEHSVLVGDSISDLEAADKAGIDFIGVRYGYGFKESVVDGIKFVDTVEELRELLLN